MPAGVSAFAAARRRGQDHRFQEVGPVEANRSEPQTMTEIDHVAIAVRDLDAAIEWYGSALGARIAHRERVRTRWSRGSVALRRRVLHTASLPYCRQLPGGEIPGAQRRRHPPCRLPGGRLCRGTGQDASRRRSADRCIAQGRVAGHDRSLRPSSQRLRHAHRARSGVAPERGSPVGSTLPELAVELEQTLPGLRREILGLDHSRGL